MSRKPADRRRIRESRRARTLRGFVPSIQPLEARQLMTGEIYVSDLAWSSSSNGLGPVERDASVGGGPA
ncbi:NPCBM/NEW2 domain-containing protein [Paludisphaera rhizosphaerae]|uniref:NPCBM/NEW2 domain-containing protein n=1 Tax=Paludisphaera rhizosphaerae TaxID=2711216 RepID=UPI0013ED4C61|nr:hypothetical protein [Paludisphaera rhizosphaerae]